MEREQNNPSAVEKTVDNEISSHPEEWVDKHGDYLFRFALLRLHDRQSAEDMVQETFLAALKTYESFQGKSSERTWLVGILKRKIIDYYRRNSRFVSLKNEDEAQPLSDFIEQGKRQGRWKDSFAPKDWGKNPDSAMEQREFRVVLQRCINGMTRRLAALFTMREIDDRSTEEICKELNISASNVWVMLHRARTQLRRCLEVNWFSTEK